MCAVPSPELRVPQRYPLFFSGRCFGAAIRFFLGGIAGLRMRASASAICAACAAAARSRRESAASAGPLLRLSKTAWFGCG